MDIDWVQIRGALSRIERELSKARDVIETSDDTVASDWPEVGREDLEAAFPDWRKECRHSFKEFLERRIGADNYRVRRGNRTYRISPECLRALNLTAAKG